ncbi:di-trans,poly-cis-decaprenylcistransferase [Candidatus Pacearchaeota archaeon]|nr:di-trans,poly-cis-decaprenylcistransferase [Candidatus Pacearchaeota archaeon]
MGSDKLPAHVVIIPDGNRRWARARGLKPWEGHYKSGSYDNLISLFREAKKLGVKYLSIWAFSTENWKRDKKEVDILLNLTLKRIMDLGKEIHKDKIRIRHLGRKDRIPAKLARELEKLEKETSGYKDSNVQILLDYGGRDEILRAVNKLVEKGEKVDELTFSKALDTADIPDVDLIIRTSGEKRLSGLMPFQGVYAELCFVDKHFPDFNAEDLRTAVEDFGKRKRNFGGN